LSEFINPCISSWQLSNGHKVCQLHLEGIVCIASLWVIAFTKMQSIDILGLNSLIHLSLQVMTVFCSLIVRVGSFDLFMLLLLTGFKVLF